MIIMAEVYFTVSSHLYKAIVTLLPCSIFGHHCAPATL